MNHKETVKDPAMRHEDIAGDEKKTENLNFERDGSFETEFGGPQGLEPTRYGDWERKGRCIDF